MNPISSNLIKPHLTCSFWSSAERQATLQLEVPYTHKNKTSYCKEYTKDAWRKAKSKERSNLPRQVQKDAKVFSRCPPFKFQASASNHRDKCNSYECGAQQPQRTTHVFAWQRCSSRNENLFLPALCNGGKWGWRVHSLENTRGSQRRAPQSIAVWAWSCGAEKKHIKQMEATSCLTNPSPSQYNVMNRWVNMKTKHQILATNSFKVFLLGWWAPLKKPLRACLNSKNVSTRAGLVIRPGEEEWSCSQPKAFEKSRRVRAQSNTIASGGWDEHNQSYTYILFPVVSGNVGPSALCTKILQSTHTGECFWAFIEVFECTIVYGPKIPIQHSIYYHFYEDFSLWHCCAPLRCPKSWKNKKYLFLQNQECTSPLFCLAMYKCDMIYQRQTL